MKSFLLEKPIHNVYNDSKNERGVSNVVQRVLNQRKTIS